MNGNTFNVSEFNSIYTMIEENSNRVSMKTNQIVALCEQLAQLVKSTDSNLSGAYLKVGEALNVAKNKVVNLLRQLEEEMKVYASKTMANEEETSARIKEINANIESIANIFKDIASRNG